MNNNTISNQTCLPDPEICRTTCMEQFADSSKCLVEHPDSCGFAVRLGSGVYCYHPDRFSFEKPESSADFDQSQVNHPTNGGRR
jgi:hypothetical protein